jgi:hypothetical protein
MTEFVFAIINKGKFLVLAVYLSFVFWVPINNYDSLTTYLARFTYERYGPLSETGTQTIQSTFPRTFDILFLPFMNWGWFETLPSLVLTGVYLICLRFWFQDKKDFFSLSLLVLSCLPVFAVTVTSSKNDAALGVFAFAALTILVFVSSERFYKLGLICTLLSLLLGTKWHGFIIAGIILAVALFSEIRASGYRKLFKQIPFTILLSPLMFFLADGVTYWRNLSKFGTLFPTSPEISIMGTESFSFLKIINNLISIIITWFFETFDHVILMLPISSQIKTSIWGIANDMSVSPRVRLGIFENSEISTVGIMGIIILIVSFSNYQDNKSRFFHLQIVSFLYFCFLISFFEYSEWRNRYFLPVLMLLIPLFISRILKLSRKGLNAFFIMSLLISFSTLGKVLVFNQERPLISASYNDPYSKTPFAISSIFDEGSYRQALRFQVWSGYKDVDSYVRGNIQKADSFLVVNNSKDYPDPPFIEPFLRFRSVENTFFINTTDSFSWNSEFVMIYKRSTPVDSRYSIVFDYPGRYQIEIFQKNP